MHEIGQRETLAMKLICPYTFIPATVTDMFKPFVANMNSCI